jgi:hypothetical protein
MRPLTLEEHGLCSLMGLLTKGRSPQFRTARELWKPLHRNLQDSRSEDERMTRRRRNAWP